MTKWISGRYLISTQPGISSTSKSLCPSVDITEGTLRNSGSSTTPTRQRLNTQRQSYSTDHPGPSPASVFPVSENEKYSNQAQEKDEPDFEQLIEQGQKKKAQEASRQVSTQAFPV